MKPRRVPWLSYALVAAGAILMVLPFADMVFVSFKGPGEFGRVPYQFLPDQFGLSNYSKAFAQLDIPKLLRNSVLMSVVTVASVLLTSSLAGYALAKLRFTGRAVVFRFVLATMMFPPFLFLIPDFLILAHWPGVGGNDAFGQGGVGGLLSSPLALVMPFLVSGFGVFLMRQFILAIPEEVLESARIDGAGELRVWWSIVVPQTKPAMVTLGLLTFVQVWNEYIWPLLVSTVNPDLMTLPVGVQLLQGFLDPAHTQPLVAAGLVISTAPVLIVFLLFQKYYVRGIMLSGLK